MAPEDEEKIIFITDRDLFYYRIMPFGLKNVGAMYQREQGIQGANRMQHGGLCS